jgi:hypothetical protein
MRKQVSFSKYEQDVRGSFREMVNSAESVEDVKKFFVYAFQDLLDKALEGKVAVEYEDVHLEPNEKSGYSIGNRLLGIQDFVLAWKNSDLAHIVGRLAESAIKRCKRLEEHRDKTEAKMYPTPG